MAKGKGTGKPCGASHIAADKVCRVSMPSAIGRALNAATGEIGANTLYQAAKAVGPGNLKRYHEIRLKLNKEVGGNIVKGARADEFKKRLQEAGVIPNGKPKSVAPEEPVAKWDKGQRDKSVPPDLKARLAQLKPSENTNTKATPATKQARESAKKFDDEMRTQELRRDGDKSFDKWDETSGSGAKKLGQGAFGTVMKSPDGKYAVKRGDVSDTEARLIQKLGEQDLGPKLIAADADGPGLRSTPGVDGRRGRIAMSVVSGSPIGSKKPDALIGGVQVADAYWTARANLHRMGIAHNDMHTDNVLIDRKGKGRFVDMGLAQDNPKAALSEAMGMFDRMPSGGFDNGNGGDWQVKRWKNIGGRFIRVLEYGKNAKQKDLEEAQKNFPALSRVVANKQSAMDKLASYGLNNQEIANVMTHGIRRRPASYNNGAWAKLTDQQALSVIDTLYQGI